MERSGVSVVAIEIAIPPNGGRCSTGAERLVRSGRPGRSAALSLFKSGRGCPSCSAGPWLGERAGLDFNTHLPPQLEAFVESSAHTAPLKPGQWGWGGGGGQSIKGHGARPDWILVSHERYGEQAVSKSATRLSDAATCKCGLKRKQTKTSVVFADSKIL